MIKPKTSEYFERAKFEAWISGPPYEHDIDRYPDDAMKYSWPMSYKKRGVELAWEAWKESKKQTT